MSLHLAANRRHQELARVAERLVVADARIIDVDGARDWHRGVVHRLPPATGYVTIAPS